MNRIIIKALELLWEIYLKLKSRIIKFDLTKIYYIDPQKVSYVLQGKRSSLKTIRNKGKLLDTDWDIESNKHGLNDTPLYVGCHQRFILGMKWEHTDYFKFLYGGIISGEPIWECKSREEIYNRCAKYDHLYEEIKKYGYKEQSQLKQKNIFQRDHEIRICIGRAGEYVLYEGRHRLTIAKILGLRKVPVEIEIIHPQWLHLNVSIMKQDNLYPMTAIYWLEGVIIDLLKKEGFWRKIKWYIRKINISRRITINKRSMNIPLIFGMSCVVTEPWMIDLLNKLLKEKDGMFIDIGVNVGQTLIKLKALDPERAYVGFEPNPSCVFYVNELIKKNRFQNCTLFPVGLFTHDGVMSLDFNSDNQTDQTASLIANYRPDKKLYSQIYVPVFRFESVSSLLNIDNVGLIKIDVEGAELEVIKSLSGIIRDYRPIILLEVHPVFSNENVFRIKRQEELEQIVKDLNYVIFRVKKTKSYTYAGLKRIESIGIHSDLNQCNYVITPNEISARLQDEAEETANSNFIKTLCRIPRGLPRG